MAISRVERILRKHGYPPDTQARATELVLEQAEVLSELWAVAQRAVDIGRLSDAEFSVQPAGLIPAATVREHMDWNRGHGDS
jgi:hypothetical protein